MTGVASYVEVRAELRQFAGDGTGLGRSTFTDLTSALAALGITAAAAPTLKRDRQTGLQLDCIGTIFGEPDHPFSVHIDPGSTSSATNGASATVIVESAIPRTLGSAGFDFAPSEIDPATQPQFDSAGKTTKQRASQVRAIRGPSLLSSMIVNELELRSGPDGQVMVTGMADPQHVGLPEVASKLVAQPSYVHGLLQVDKERLASGSVWFGNSEGAKTSLAGVDFVGMQWGLEADELAQPSAQTALVARASLVVGQHRVPCKIRYQRGNHTIIATVDVEELDIKPATLLSALAKAYGLSTSDSLPEPFTSLGGAELTDFTLSVQLDPLELLGVGLGLGLSDPVEIVPDLLRIEQLSAGLVIWSPLSPSSRDVVASIEGVLDIGGVDLSLEAIGRSDGLEFTAALKRGEVVDLASLIKQVLPGIVLPASLVADDLKVSYQTGDVEFSGQLSTDLVLDIGPTDVRLRTLRFDLEYSAETDSRLHGSAALSLGTFDFVAEVEWVDKVARARAATDPSSEIGLTRLARAFATEFGVSLPPMPDVSVTEVEAEFDSARRLVAVSARTVEPLVASIAGSSVSIDGWFQLGTERIGNQQAVFAHLLGEVDFADRTVEATVNLSSQGSGIELGWVADSPDETLSLSALVDACGVGSVELPDIDVSIDEIELTFDAPTSSLKLAANSPELGEIELLARKRTSGKWHHQLWIEFPDTTDGVLLERLAPGAGGLVDSFGLTDLSLAIASVASSPADPPDRRLDAGLSLVATMALDPANDLHAALTKSTGSALLHVRASFGPGGASLVAYLDGEVSLTDDLALGDAFVAFQTSPFGISIGGTLSANVGPMALKATGAVLLSATEFKGRLAVSAIDPITGEPANLLEPLGIRAVTLSKIGFDLGVRFVPPSVTFGMVAAFGLGEQPSDSNRMAIGLQVIPSAPIPIVNITAVAFFVRQLDVATILDVFIDEAPTLPAAIADMALSDIDFRYAPTPIVLADGSALDVGFGLAGAVDVFGISAKAALAVDRSSGIRGAFTMSPLDIEVGGLSLISISGADGHGGPVFAFSSRGPTYLMADAQIEFLGLLKQKVVAEVTAEGFEFLLGIDISDALNIELKCRFAGGAKPSFSASATFDLDLDVEIPVEIAGLDLGTIDLDSSLHLMMAVSASPDEFSMVFDGDFEFEGLKIDFPRLELSIAPKDLLNIPAMLIDQILDSASELFSQFFEGVEELWNDATEAIGEAYDAVEAEIVEFAGHAADTVAELVEGIDDAVDAVADGLDSAIEEAEQLGAQALELVSDGVAAVEAIHAEAAEIVDQVEQEIKHGIAVAAQTAALIANEAVELVQDIELVLRNVAEAARKEFVAIMDDAMATANKVIADAAELVKQIWDAAGKLVEEFERAAAAFLAEADRLWSEVERLAEEVGLAVRDGAIVVADFTVNAVEDTGEFFVNGTESVLDEIGSWF